MRYLFRFMYISFFLVICILVFSFFNKDVLMSSKKVQASTLKDPIQTQINNPQKFTRSKSGHKYTITPIYDYQISGIVVHKMDYRTKDGTRDVARFDLCIVWGNNVADDLYLNGKAEFSQNGRFCTYRYSQGVQFDNNQLSNNHLFTFSDDDIKLIEAINNGDEVLITGKLIDVDSPLGTWRSSTTRTDREGGACEVIYVDSIKVLSHSSNPYVALNKYSLYATIILAALILLRILMAIIFPGKGSKINHNYAFGGNSGPMRR